MDHDDELSSSQEEGFYKPPELKVEADPLCEDITLPLNSPGDTWQANQLIQRNRPTDYLPRVLTSAHPLLPYELELNGNGVAVREELVALRLQRAKKSKYCSIRDRYRDNSQYSLVYSKLQASEEQNSYIFSLNQTTDFNPKDYQTMMEQQAPSISQFQSRFESGNLLLAYKVNSSDQQEYDLILQNDTNTRGYNNWFFFSFENKTSKRVKFNIVNLIKRHCLFEDGVRPVGWSFQNRQKGWHSVGWDIDYQKSYLTRQIHTNPPTYKSYYTLSFTLDFDHEHDKYYIAMNYPYTYTRMVGLTAQLTSQCSEIKIQRQILGYSISNNPIVMLRIRHQEFDQAGGKRIVVMARQHPGQTVGSYVFEGFLKNIINEPVLLQEYEVIAVPMVNPDGVIYGNFRTNLSGFDLNRQWQEPDKWMHPQIYTISKFLSSLQGISFVLDFHGHSKKYNSFIYACNGEPTYVYRVFPYIFGKNSPFFSIQDCTYSITPDKERTARIQIYRAIKKPQVFTLQTSFFGYSNESGKKFRFSIKDLLKLGKDTVQSLKMYLLTKKQVAAVEKEVRQKEFLFQQWAHQIRKDDLESESNPSEDELTPVQRKQKVIATKTARRLKPKSKSKKKGKVKRDSSILNLSALKRLTEEKCQISLEKQVKIPLKKQTTGPVVVSQKKIESQKILYLHQTKVKPKKVEKIISIISPHPPKPPTKAKGPSFMQKEANSEIKLKLQFEKLNNIQSKPVQRMQGGQMIQTITSNLFNKPNYFSYFQQKTFKRQAQSVPSHNKTQSLEINSVKRETTYSHGNTMDVLRKMVSGEEAQKRQTRIEQARRNRDKMYMLRENRIISSTARMNEQAMKRNLEEDIANRTLALKNCQKKMHQITLDEPLIRSDSDSYAIEYLNGQLRQTCSVKAPKFPAIKGEKRRDYFNF